jgi:hypothetical protein
MAVTSQSPTRPTTDESDGRGRTGCVTPQQLTTVAERRTGHTRCVGSRSVCETEQTLSQSGTTLSPESTGQFLHENNGADTRHNFEDAELERELQLLHTNMRPNFEYAELERSFDCCIFLMKNLPIKFGECVMSSTTSPPKIEQ